MILITLQNGIISAGIKPFGAELSSLRNLRTEREYIWSGDSTYWSGQAPILFPICGRLLSDCFEFDGEKYYLPKHGFARKSPFEIASVSETEAEFVLRSGEETKRVYPFDFVFHAVFSLDGKTLRTTYRVENVGEKTMYFSVGGHPAFACQMGDRIKFDELETVPTCLFDASSLRVGEKPFLKNHRSFAVTEHLFDGDALFFPGLKSRGVELTTATGKRIVRVEYGDVPYLGIWAKPGAPFVCIEPWNGINDTPDVSGKIEEKDAILSLPAGQTYVYSFTITVA